MAPLQSKQQRVAALVLLLSFFTPICSAACVWYTYPDFSGATCNAAPDSPDTSASLETVIYITEDNPGDCATDYGVNQVYQYAVVTYTGLDGTATTVSAFNPATDANPSVTGTYTFSYDVPYSSMQGGSPVTHAYQWTSEGGVTDDTYTFSFIENHDPTILLTAATSTVTYPYQVYKEITRTKTHIVTETFTAATETSTVYGTRTIFAPRPTTTTTETITRGASTVFVTSVTTITTSVGCQTWPGHRTRNLKDRQVPITYEPPNCADPTTTTYTTSVSIALKRSTTTVTDTDYATIVSVSIHRVPDETVYQDVGTTVTVTPEPFTMTSYTRLARATVTETNEITVTNTAVPSGGPGRCGDWAPHWPPHWPPHWLPHHARPIHGPSL